jgi:hypothetical protein
MTGPRGLEILGSDKARQLVMGRCPLCSEYRQFVLGHVAPKWAASWGTAEGHLVGRYASLGARTKVQDYTKHYTFCRECDQFLGDAERYLAALVKGTARDLESVGVRLFPRPGGEAVIAGLNVTVMFRALCGIALKIHLSKAQMYTRHTLQPTDVAQVVAALRADAYPLDTFTAVGYKLVNRLLRGANPRASLILEIRRSHGGSEVHIHMAGWRFVLFCGATAVWMPDQGLYERQFIGQTTYWTTNVLEWVDEPGSSRPGPPLTVSERRIRATDLCPCGLGLEFASCCSGRWLPADDKWVQRPYRSVTWDGDR